ncbi:MAG: GTPase HflX [Spirochaetia bacterium]|nr:GTPase HflX [Spirochaetia bacterium]
MYEVEEEAQKKVRCLLVIPQWVHPQELKNLVKTLDMEVVDIVTLPEKTSAASIARFGIGSGKAQEITQLAEAQEADCIIFDTEITPTRQRNWETLAGIPVFDRQEVILRIFAQRARTKEAVLQVELAQLTYSLPRLAHSYGDMARQRGGSYGSKGAGETKLELDRRSIQSRIVQVKRELEKVVQERQTQRKRREKIPLPTCALVGYTNAGKSSLLNALTGSQVLAQDKLFATLDPTTRRLSIAGGTGLLLTDTVGFISNLPHSLVDAFKSTLEEAVQAQLLLVVVDAADVSAVEQYNTVCQVLEEIGATDNNRLIVLNKTDQLEKLDLRRTTLQNSFPNAIEVSAITGAGLPQLMEAIAQELAGPIATYKIPLTQVKLLEQIRQQGVILEEQWLDTHIHLTARPGSSSGLQAQLENYIWEE